MKLLPNMCLVLKASEITVALWTNGYKFNNVFSLPWPLDQLGWGRDSFEPGGRSLSENERILASGRSVVIQIKVEVFCFSDAHITICWQKPCLGNNLLLITYNKIFQNSENWRIFPWNLNWKPRGHYSDHKFVFFLIFRLIYYRTKVTMLLEVQTSESDNKTICSAN